MSCRKNFVGTKNEFRLAMVNEPSMFELLRFDCTLVEKSALPDAKMLCMCLGRYFLSVP